MHKLMWRFVTTTKKKKIPDRNLDTSCPAGIPSNKKIFHRYSAAVPIQCTYTVIFSYILAYLTLTYERNRIFHPCRDMFDFHGQLEAYK